MTDRPALDHETTRSLAKEIVDKAIASLRDDASRANPGIVAAPVLPEIPTPPRHLPSPERIPIPDGEVNHGGTVDAKAQHVIPLRDEYVPWHQGTLPAWKTQDDYAEYAHVDGSWSLATTAVRLRVDLRTTQTNERRYHDWKGYDDIEPATTTKIYFNGRHVGTVTNGSTDLLRHLVDVSRHIDKLRSLGVFSWWTEKDIEAVIGRAVEYKGHAATVRTLFLDQSTMVLDCPTWPADDWYDAGTVKVGFFDPGLSWYPSEPATDGTNATQNKADQ